MPANTEALRTKYEVLTNLWLLAQSRRRGRKMYADFTELNWMRFAKEQLNEDTFGLQRDIHRAHLLGHIASSKNTNLRKEAPRLCFEEGYSIQEALWSAYADPQHRMKHWIQLAVSNSKSASSCADQQKMATLESKVAELERKTRSHPPQRAIKGAGKRQEKQRRTTRSPGRRSERYWQKQGSEKERQQKQRRRQSRLHYRHRLEVRRPHGLHLEQQKGSTTGI